MEGRYLWVYVASFMVVHAARLGRWVVMVRGISDAPTADVVGVGLAGFAAIVLFPLRLGEFVRPLLLQRRAGVPFSAGLGTAVVERVADGLIITLVLFLSVLAAPVAASEVVRSAGWASLLVFLSATIGLTLFAWKRWLAERIASETVGRISPNLSRGLIGTMETFSVGVRSLYGGGRLWWFLLLTVVYWSANAFGMWWLARGFGFMLPWYAGWGLLGTLVVGLMIPTGPGFGEFSVLCAGGAEALSAWFVGRCCRTGDGAHSERPSAAGAGSGGCSGGGFNGGRGAFEAGRWGRFGGMTRAPCAVAFLVEPRTARM